jgi:hypothetical protein
VNARFRVDLLHPGWVAESWEGWLAGPFGARRLAAVAVGGLGALLLVVVAGILPTYWQLNRDRSAEPALRAELATRDADLRVLRSNLQALSTEARRQVRWSELLTALSQQIPPEVKLQLVESARPAAPAPGAPQAPGTAVKTDEMLRIDAITPARPGSPPLVDVSRFLGGLVRDPAMHKRFDVRSWEIKPVAAITPGDQYLNLQILLAERPQ